MSDDADGLHRKNPRLAQELDRTPLARTTFEMRFAASLVPCPGCGSRGALTEVAMVRAGLRGG